MLSCESLVQRAENKQITEVVILPFKKLKDQDVLRLIRCHELRILSCSGHKLAPSTLALVGESLAYEKTNLRSLAIGDSSLGDEGIEAFCRKGSLGKLESLDLSSKNMTSRGLEWLAASLGSSTTLQRLDISRNPIDLRCLPQSCTLPRCIRRLNLSSQKHFDRNILSNIAELDTLVLSGTPMENVDSLPSARELQISNCGLKGDISLCDQQLETLDLSNNANISRVFLDCPGLTSINVRACSGIVDWTFLQRQDGIPWSFVDVSETPFFETLTENITPTKHLRAFQCGLDLDGKPEDFRKIFQACFSSNGSILETLDLAGNGSRVNGLLWSLLENSELLPSLRTLIIGGNKPLDADARDLLTRLQTERSNLDIIRDK